MNAVDRHFGELQSTGLPFPFHPIHLEASGGCRVETGPRGRK